MLKLLSIAICLTVFSSAYAQSEVCSLDLRDGQWNISHCGATETHAVSMQNFAHALQAAVTIPSEFSAIIKREPKYYMIDNFRYQLQRQRDLVEQMRESSDHLQDLIEVWPWDTSAKNNFIKKQAAIRQNALRDVNIARFTDQHNSLVHDIIAKISASKELHLQLDTKQLPKVLAGIFSSKIFSAAVLPIETKAIPPGQYSVGSKDTDKARFKDEPASSVKISAPTLVQVDLFTQLQWFQLTGSNPSRFKFISYCPASHVIISGTDLCPDYPVENVSANDVDWALQFLNSSSSAKYRLPTATEWEIASRAGADSVYSFGDSAGEIDKYVFYQDNADGHTHKVSSKMRNPWGIGDASGHVWQMTADTKNSETSYTSAAHAHLRIVKGGSWTGGPRLARPATNLGVDSNERYSNVGFRLVGASSTEAHK